MNIFITLSHILLYELLVSIIRRISIMCYLNKYNTNHSKGYIPNSSLKTVLVLSYILESSEKTRYFQVIMFFSSPVFSHWFSTF